MNKMVFLAKPIYAIRPIVAALYLSGVVTMAVPHVNAFLHQVKDMLV